MSVSGLIFTVAPERIRNLEKSPISRRRISQSCPTTTRLTSVSTRWMAAKTFSWLIWSILIHHITHSY